MANSLHVKKGDRVKVIAGNDKGKIGEIISVDPKARKVVVEGVNIVKKHTPANPNQAGQSTGGIVTTEAPIHVSNVMLVDPETKKGTRVGYRTETVERDGRQRTVRVRIAKRSGKDI